VRFGVPFPHEAIGTDVATLRDYVQGAEAAGFDYLSAVDHVAGAHPDRFTDVDIGFPAPPYSHTNELHEPLTLFAYLAAITTTLEFATSVLVLPQRQTVLVAKQSAEVALLSGGRLRLGIGVGWNFAEYESLNVDFHTRGRRQEEQIVVLRKLWTEPLVSFDGDFHTIDRVGIAPLPAQTIPIWIGGGFGERTMRRVAKYGDGWMPSFRPDIDLEAIAAQMRAYLDDEGRDPSSLGIQSGVAAWGGPTEWVETARRWVGLGVTDMMIMGEWGTQTTPMESLKRAIEVKRVLTAELGV
jgi:probable F420-dependent oxidoreductase